MTPLAVVAGKKSRLYLARNKSQQAKLLCQPREFLLE